MRTSSHNSTKIILVLAAVLALIPSLTFADIDGIEGVVWYIVTGVFGFFAGLAGKLLNVGINDFVIGFGDLYTSGGLGAAVDLAWVSVRDIFNITFIFGLVYIGFKMILNSDDSNTKRWLVHLIMAAILVNFSLYFTKFVVDFTNIIASEVALAGFVHEKPEVGLMKQPVGYVLVSDTFANAIGFTSILGGGTDTGESQITVLAEKKGPLWGYIFGTMIMLVIATFVFAAGGFLLIIRAAVLCIYLVLSPLMFIGWVFPKLQKYTDDYWSGFLGRAFFAPVYILMLYLSASIVQNYTNVLGSTAGPAAIGNAFLNGGSGVNHTFVGSFTPFILGSIFLIASIIIANKMGANGASMVMSVGKKATATGRRWAVGGAKQAALGVSYPLRLGARSAVSSVGQNIKYATLKAQQKIDPNAPPDSFSNMIGRIARTNVVQDQVLGRLTPALEGNKMGFERDEEGDLYQKQHTLLRAERRNQIAAGAVALKRQEAYANNKYMDEEGNIIEGQFENMTDVEKVALTDQQATEVTLAMKAVKDTNTSEIKNMPDQIKYAMVPFMEMSKYEALQKDEDIDKVVRDKMETLMQESIKSSFTRVTDKIDAAGNKIQIILNDQLKKLTAKQIDVLGVDWAVKNAGLLVNQQMTEIKRIGMMSDTFYESFLDTHKRALNENVKKIPKDKELPEKLDEEGVINLNDSARMLYKIVNEYDDVSKKYVTKGSFKSGKNIATQLHPDAIKAEDYKLAQYLDTDWITTFAAEDRAMTKMSKSSRNELLEKWKIIAEEKVEDGNYSQKAIARAKANIEYLQNEQGHKIFFGESVDNIKKSTTKSKGAQSNSGKEKDEEKTYKSSQDDLIKNFEKEVSDTFKE
ncbi:hypothetical protein KC730_01580 [Candidatus Kaiserbacteria bacterium]|nr:hypothetical protein [Candidatus Kaiserbacteria bacterium]